MAEKKKGERIPMTKRKLGKQKPGFKTMTLKELGLPNWEDIVSMFFHTHCMEAGQAIAHWIHTPDCSSDVRELIRDALKLDGSTKENKAAQYLFKCPTCCDSTRIGKDKEWIECPDCQPAKEP